MEYIVIPVMALLGSGLTLFSGFGLGTILMPVFAIFYPVEIAISMTAVVHLANNLMKLAFFRKYIEWRIALKFGLPAIIAAILGAFLLGYMAESKPIWEYQLFNNTYRIHLVSLVVSILLIIFALFEFIPRWSGFTIHPKYLPMGGLVSGFFGGLSGHQGALRSVFLIRAGLSKEAFIGTGVILACFIDIGRISVYSMDFLTQFTRDELPIMVLAMVSAFVGVFLGTQLIRKITLRSLQWIVAVVIVLFGLLLGIGII